MTRYQLVAEGGVFDHQARALVRANKTDPAWLDYLAWVTAGNTPLPPDTACQLDLAEARAAKIAEIDAYAAGLRNRFVRGRSVGEMASWAIKLLDAMAVTAAQPTPFAALMPTLQTALGLPALPTSVNHALGMVRGISEADHAAKVMAQGLTALGAEIVVDAVRGKHCDAIAAMPDVRDVITYDWHAGWPAL